MMGKMTFDSLLSEIRKMKREQRLGLLWDTLGLAIYSTLGISLAVLSFNAFWWSFGGDETGVAKRAVLFVGALACLYQSGKFVKVFKDSCEYESFGIHRRNLRKIAKVEKRFRIYKRAFEIKKERYGKD